MEKILKLTALLALLAITACSKLDVVGKDSVRAFNDLLQSAPQLVSRDDAKGGWSIAAPDNSVRFIWSKNFAESQPFDVMLEFDVAPFVLAGLNPSQLPNIFTLKDGMLTVGGKLGKENLNYNGEATPLASYKHIVKLKRGSINYHAQMDHYGINLGYGNIFEWAKNMATNDNDIVFVLDPSPFIAAGTDPAYIEGWDFTQVTIDDAYGKPIQVDKIISSFDLK
jgi:hypothetical protein